MSERRTKDVPREEWPEGALDCWRDEFDAMFWIHDHQDCCSSPVLDVWEEHIEEPFGRVASITNRHADLAEEIKRLRVQLERTCSDAAEAVILLNDKQMRELCGRRGEDIEAEAEKTRAILLSAVKRWKETQP